MALVTQIRLPSLTGSLGASSGDVQQSDLTAATALDEVAGTGIITILQGFADAIGKIQGDTDWTNSTHGHRFAGTSPAYDLLTDQMSSSKALNIFSSGTMKISKIGNADPLVIRTGDGLGVAAGGIEINSQVRLILSASSTGDNAVTVNAGGGGFLVETGKKIDMLASAGGVELGSDSSSDGITLQSSALNSSIVLSASLGMVQDLDSSAIGKIDVFAKNGMSFYSSGSFASSTDVEWGVIGPYTPSSGEGWFQLEGQNQNVRVGALAASHGSVAQGRLYLSGANNVFFADKQTCTETSMDQGFGPGSWALSAAGEMTTYVANFSDSTTLLGSINSLKASIAGTEPSIHRHKMSAALAKDTSVDVGTAEVGTPSTLSGYATNTVQVMLNGQLLVSASGASGGVVPASGDYYIFGDGSTNEIRFGFQLEADDQIQVWNLA